MPRKIRQLKADLRRAGFVELRGRGKGDHSLWQHPIVPTANIGLDGQDCDDAMRYLEKDLREILDLVARVLAERQALGRYMMIPSTQSERVTHIAGATPPYSMLLEWDTEDHIYVVSVPELPGLHTHGTTYAEAAARGAERIAEWVAILAESGLPLPAPHEWHP